jgi:hypothetical protein
MISHLGRSWLLASNDLGLRVTIPFLLTTDSGDSLHYDVLVNDFGSTLGMLLMETWDEDKAKLAAENGYGYSCIDCAPYDRESTIEVLRDWGWSGSAMAPAWAGT